MAKSNSITLFGRAKDEVGNVYGNLTVIAFAGSGSSELLWRCRCQCGREVAVRGSSLRNGHTKSCGCLARSASGKCNAPEYRIWYAMNHRCHSPTNTHYRHYGGRGIAVCERWRESFGAFFEDMGPKPFPEATIDRIDNDGNYEPGNCRWATRREQCVNTRSTHLLSYNGETMCLSDWGRRLGIAYQTILYRIRRGWPEERIFSSKQ